MNPKSSTRPTQVTRMLLFVAAGAVFLLGLVGCSSESSSETSSNKEANAVDAASQSIEVISVEQASALLASPPPNLQIVDVRTPEEFSAGHIEGATMIDFEAPDFRSNLSKLDKTAPYFIYCRSGNRSGQAREIMDEMGFSSVKDLNGGILAWTTAGKTLVTE